MQHPPQVFLNYSHSLQVDHEKPDNNRPVSLLPILSKVLLSNELHLINSCLI